MSECCSVLVSARLSIFWCLIVHFILLKCLGLILALRKEVRVFLMLEGRVSETMVEGGHHWMLCDDEQDRERV